MGEVKRKFCLTFFIFYDIITLCSKHNKNHI